MTVEKTCVKNYKKFNEDLSVLIKDSISKIDDNLSYEDFAIAVANVIKDDYGTHNYELHIS
jgi:hypothetical protein